MGTIPKKRIVDYSDRIPRDSKTNSANHLDPVKRTVGDTTQELRGPVQPRDSVVFLILIGTAEREKDKEGMTMTMKVFYSVSIGQSATRRLMLCPRGLSCHHVRLSRVIHNYEYGSDWKMTPMI